MKERNRKFFSVALAAVVFAGSFAGFSFESKASSAGISIDGDFSDWAGVAKYDIDEGKGYDTVNQMAAVWDSEYVYLYFHSNSWDWGAVTGAGGWNNGQYTLTSDLGRELLIQLSRDNNGSVAGVDGAMCAVNNTNWEEGHDWEVAVPVSALPENNGTFSFGTYLGQTVISGITNIDAVAGDTTLPEVNDPSNSMDIVVPDAGLGDGAGESQVDPGNTTEGGNKIDSFIESSSGMTYDGSYSDWKGYPMTHIDYATGGTGAHVADGYGALFCDGSILYGYGESSYEAHLQESGGEFTSAVTIMLNNSYSYCFWPRFVEVAADGSINWNPQLSGLSAGSHEFYIFDTAAWGTATNINSLDSNNVCYGKMTVTIGASMDQMEFFMDMQKLAAKFGLEPDRIETVSAQYGRIGQQWIGTAGTSTLPIISVGLIVLCVAGYYVGKRRKAKEA